MFEEKKKNATKINEVETTKRAAADEVGDDMLASVAGGRKERTQREKVTCSICGGNGAIRVKDSAFEHSHCERCPQCNGAGVV